MLREIRVYGQLAKFLGRRTFKAAVSNAAEAIRFLIANFPQLEKHMAEQQYKVSAGRYSMSLGELHDPVGQQTIKIVPVIGGASGSSVGDILIGAALIATSLLFAPGAALASSAFTLGPVAVGIGVSIGASLVLGGTAQLLTPAPSLTPIGNSVYADANLASTEGTELDPQASYSFGGVQNTSRQGVPLPLVYGEMVVGSIVISAGIDTVQVEA